MILDNFLTFTGTSNGASGGITAAAQTDSPTTGTEVASNIVDLGVTSGVPSSANGGGARDIGVGTSLYLSCIVTTAFTGGTSLQLLLAGAPDDGAGAAGTYVTMWTSFAYTEATLLAGAQLANIEVPRPKTGQVLPRFLRLSFVTVGTHSAGAAEAGIILNRDDQVLGVGGIYSGYPAGLTVSN